MRIRLAVVCCLCEFVFVALMGIWFLVSIWFGLIVQGPYHPELDTMGPSPDARLRTFLLYPDYKNILMCFIGM